MTNTPSPWLEFQAIVDRDGHWNFPKLADATGYSAEYLRLLWIGRRRPTPAAIRRLADVLRVPYSVLEPGPRDNDTPTDAPTSAGAA